MAISHTSDILDFNGLAPDALTTLLHRYQLSLTPNEALTIQNTILNRAPTLSECILWSIQGSEHCSYKSTRHYLRTLVTDGPNVILGAKEDAGIVTVATDTQGVRYGIVMSHESHNHPSQIVPYEGAATGVGGNVRDVSCMGATVIAIADGLRFGAVHRPQTRWLQEGVVAGIAGYANPIGVPTIAGDVYYDPGYNDNCLVTVVTLGTICETDVIHSYAPANAENHVYILVGKPTDNSGFGGASFASTNLAQDQHEKNKGAIQEPNAFLKRHLLKANQALFKLLKERQCLDQVGFKDLGAGGIACAAVELADSGGYGAEVELAHVPTSMSHLHPSVVLCSETQERFMWVVPPDLVDTILSHYNKTFALSQICLGAQATVVGKIRTDKKFVVRFGEQVLVSALAADVTRGIVSERPAKKPVRQFSEPTISTPPNLNAAFLQLLAHENIASRDPIFEKYDKQVQGRTVVEAGLADAGVMQPFNDDSFPAEIRSTGIALSVDQTPRYNKIDPYWGAVNAVLESVCNVVAVGAMPQAITDCLCFGNPEIPEQMWEFSEAIRGIKDACAAIGIADSAEHPLPIIAGNVSLYNESQHGAIPASPMIACLGNLTDVVQIIPGHFQASDSLLVLVRERQDECGGSVYYDTLQALGANVPKPNLILIRNEIHAVLTAMKKGLILAAHDISDGGLAVAIAEMSFKNNLGADIQIPTALSADKALFSETGGFVLEVHSYNLAALRNTFARFDTPVTVIGKTTKTSQLTLQNIIAVPVDLAKHTWQNGLREKLL